MTPPSARRGSSFFAEPGVSGFIHRAFTKSMGLSDDELERPVIGICNTFSELNNCHRHFRELCEAVKRGILQAGGTPLEFPTISLGEIYLSPTSMLHRNLAAMDTEEMIRAQPLDGVVLLSGCDKSTPAALMGLASADVPAIMVSGGPMLDGHHDGQRLGACTDCRRLTAENRAGTLDDLTYQAIEDRIVRSAGHCMVMGTASTMNSLTEALGIALPGNGAIPAVDSRRLRLARASGQRIVSMVAEDLRPSKILTRKAFENAVTVFAALGGSTNAVVHLPRRSRAVRGPAAAGAVRLDQRADAVAREPAPDRLAPDGGVLPRRRSSRADARTAAVAGRLGADGDRPDGRGEPRPGAGCRRGRDPYARRAAAPARRDRRGAWVAGAGRRGDQARRGLARTAAAPSASGGVRGPGRLRARIDREDLDVELSDILVLRDVGPVGGPGMPEVGNFPIPRKLLARGVRDMVRISDARMSGTAYGTIVLHVAPESAVGGPLAFVRTGDEISLDLDARRLDLLVDDAELARRRAAWQPPPRPYGRGYGRLFLDHVGQAPQGCDFDFLRGRDPVVVEEQAKF